MKHFIEQLKMRFFDWLSIDKEMPCHAFGGLTGYGYNEIGDPGVGVRLCNKNRWHIDSHMYEVKYHRLYGKGAE